MGSPEPLDQFFGQLLTPHRRNINTRRQPDRPDTVLSTLKQRFRQCDD